LKNPKHEARNPKKYEIRNAQIRKIRADWEFVFKIWIFFGFRASDFVLELLGLSLE